MKISIIGTRGIPNYYGGFEQLACYLGEGLTKIGHKVFVYNPDHHPYKGDFWNGVTIIRKRGWENAIGRFGQFLFDLLCILDTRKRRFDIVLELGYTSNSLWFWLYKRDQVVVTNIDGLEWKRRQHSWIVQKYLLFAEKLAVKYSDCVISDSIGIQDYVKTKYKLDSVYIPYGGHVFDSPDKSILTRYEVQKHRFNTMIIRFLPENNTEMILEGVELSGRDEKMLVIGDYNNKFGNKLLERFKSVESIKFLGRINDVETLNNMRYYSNIYFHGHSVGGTNPSLLEAMAASALICAHDNPFNRSILGDDGFYFRDSKDVASFLDTLSKEDHRDKIASNLSKITNIYSWDNIVDQYLSAFVKYVN